MENFASATAGSEVDPEKNRERYRGERARGGNEKILERYRAASVSVPEKNLRALPLSARQKGE